MLVKKVVLLIIIFGVILVGLFVLYKEKKGVVSPLGQVKKIIEKPLEKYTFDNLKKADFAGSEITIGKLLKEGDGFNSYMFYYDVDGNPSTSSGSKRKVSGLINLPKKEGSYPVIVMFRGYVDREKFTTGEGTRRSAEVIAQNGYITLAPDFLGYGESDKPSEDSIEERFQTYTTALTLLSSVKNLNKGLEKVQCSPLQTQVLDRKERYQRYQTYQRENEKNVSKAFDTFGTFPSFDTSKLIPGAYAAEKDNDCLKNSIIVDEGKIGIWGHSNGGHIALSVLAISGKNYPTVLWNPVSKPFPYSILFFTDDFDDHGKALRRVVAKFEEDYDIEKYSPPNFYSWINASIQLHQAVEDGAVPKRWSDQLDEKLKELEKDVSYFVYPGENHNFNLGSWPTAIQRSVNFYSQKLTN